MILIVMTVSFNWSIFLKKYRGVDSYTHMSKYLKIRDISNQRSIIIIKCVIIKSNVDKF